MNINCSNEISLKASELKCKEPYVRKIKKNYWNGKPVIGRNDACVCGSGEKYKKCCL